MRKQYDIRQSARLSCLLLLAFLVNYPILFATHFFQNTSPADTITAEAYFQKGQAFFDAKKWDDACVEFLKAADLFRAANHPSGLIKSNLKAGSIRRFRTDFQHALQLYQEALDISLQANGLLHIQTVRCLDGKCMVFYNKGVYDRAQSVLDSIIHIETTLYGADHEKMTASYTLKGNIHFKQGHYDEAIQFYEKSKVIHLRDSLKNLENLASCIGNIGAASIEKGDFAKANALFLQAAELKKAKLGENSTSLAYTYYNIGDGFASQGDFQSGLDYLFKSARILRIMAGENHPDVAYVYNGIGKVYRQSGDWEQAMDYFQKSLTIRDSTQTSDHPDVARDYDQIGFVLQQKNELEAAERAYRKALMIRQKRFDPTHISLGKSYHNLGQLAVLNEDYETAKAYLQKGLAIRKEQLANYHPAIAETHTQLAKMEAQQGQWSAALEQYQMALTQLVPAFDEEDWAENPAWTDNFPYKVDLLTILYQKGMALKQAYVAQAMDREGLLAAYETLLVSSQLADEIRLDFQSDFSKKALLNNAFGVYEELVVVGDMLHQITPDQMELSALFSLLEKNKSMLLLDALNDESARQFANVSPTLLEQEKDLNRQIAFFENQLVRLKENGKTLDDSDVFQLEEKLFQRRQNRQQLLTTIEQDYPDYFQLKYDKQLAGIADLQSTLSDSETALLHYTLTDDFLYILGITQSELAYHRQPIDSSFRADLALLKKYVRTNPIGRSREQKATDKTAYIQRANQLYGQLLQPILAQLPTIQNLLIIPDGALNYLPFEALLSELPNPNQTAYDQLNYVLYDYAIHYEYSATLWWQNCQHSSPKNGQFVGFAPEYQGVDLLASRGDDQRPTAYRFGQSNLTFSPLAFNQDEVNELASTLKGKAVVGAMAMESTFKSSAKDYGILHLAMHAYVNDERPDYSHLAFSESTDTLNDRFLYAHELYNMDLSADLAVLSACETGDGQLQAGEGVMSLSRAFKYAGVPNIVMSFWKADDFYTKKLMTNFYEFLASDKGKNEALQAAKQRQIAAAKDNKDAAHPFYWANFVLVGDAASVSFSKNRDWIYWLLAALGVVALVYFLLSHLTIFANLKSQGLPK
ncbi:MAG: CHAT domain-containing tetratricopeptide repeat protein [Bacteroidota bacterium]